MCFKVVHLNSFGLSYSFGSFAWSRSGRSLVRSPWSRSAYSGRWSVNGHRVEVVRAVNQSPRPGLYPETLRPSPRHPVSLQAVKILRQQDENSTPGTGSQQAPGAKKHPKKAGQIQPGTVTPGAKKSPTASRANCYLS